MPPDDAVFIADRRIAEGEPGRLGCTETVHLKAEILDEGGLAGQSLSAIGRISSQISAQVTRIGWAKPYGFSPKIGMKASL
ncbi:MAG: hypothetical protein WDN06_11065 [Asticcacaulis sp.]